MPQSAKDVQFQELKDMIAQLNNTIRTQNKTIDTMTNMLAEKDQRLAELTEELRLLRQKIFGSSKERSAKLANSDQINMLAELGLEPEPEPELVDAEFIEVKAHKKTKESKATFALTDFRIPQPSHLISNCAKTLLLAAKGYFDYPNLYPSISKRGVRFYPVSPLRLDKRP